MSGPGWRCPGATDDEMVGVVRRWAAVESWAGAAKLGAIRELIRREDKPWLPTDQHVDQPDPWSESLTHELALALTASVGSADRTEWLSWELGTRLPGIDALLTDGTLSYGKAKAVAEAFGHLSDVDAAHAEALILGQLAGKTSIVHSNRCPRTRATMRTSRTPTSPMTPSATWSRSATETARSRPAAATRGNPTSSTPCPTTRAAGRAVVTPAPEAAGAIESSNPPGGTSPSQGPASTSGQPQQVAPTPKNPSATPPKDAPIALPPGNA